MVWLLLGVLYSSAYAIAGWTLRNQPTALSWFRAVALLVPPMTGTIVIAGGVQEAVETSPQRVPGAP